MFDEAKYRAWHRSKEIELLKFEKLRENLFISSKPVRSSINSVTQKLMKKMGILILAPGGDQLPFPSLPSITSAYWSCSWLDLVLVKE